MERRKKVRQVAREKQDIADRLRRHIPPAEDSIYERRNKPSEQPLSPQTPSDPTA